MPILFFKIREKENDMSILAILGIVLIVLIVIAVV